MDEDFNIGGGEEFVTCFEPNEPRFHVPSKLKGFYVAVGSFSILAASFLFVTIFTVKKLRAHPSVMIGYISLFEAIS